MLGLALASVVLGAVEWAAGHLEPGLVPSSLMVGAVPAEGRSHPFLLWEEAPGAREEGGLPVEINHMGFRGPDLERPKPARERRLMVLGDSIGFGSGVLVHQTLGQVAVDELGGERVGLRAVNGAVPRYSTLQTLNLMELRGWALEPDVIVVLDNPTDRAVSRHVDEEVIPPVRLPGSLARALELSALFRVLDFRLGVLQGPQYQRYLSVLEGAVQGNPDGLPRLGPNARARAVRALVDRAQDHRAGVVFLLTPVPEDLDGMLSADVKLGRKVLRDAATWAGASLVDGGAVFARTGRPAAELWLDGVHPTALGHRILGRALAQTLTQWIRGEAPGGQSRGGALPWYAEPDQENE